jgi:hypothetical protein
VMEQMRRVSMCAIVVLAIVPVLAGIDLPDPPQGFSWRKVPEIKGAFLVPDGWHVSSERAKGTLAYFITEQPFTPPDEFLVGVTINVFLGNPDAPAQIQEVVLAHVEQYKVQFGKGKFGPFDTLECQYEIPATDGHKATRVSRLAVTHPKTHAAYLVTFESPSEDWSRTWPKGEKVLKMLALNGKV